MDIDPLILVGGLIALVAAAGAALAMNAIAKQRQELRETTRMLDEGAAARPTPLSGWRSPAALGGRVGQIAEPAVAVFDNSFRDRTGAATPRRSPSPMLGSGSVKALRSRPRSRSEPDRAQGTAGRYRRRRRTSPVHSGGGAPRHSQQQAGAGRVRGNPAIGHRDGGPAAHAYDFQVTLDGGVRADCLLKLPNPPGPIVIDAKFPLESFTALHAATSDAERDAARRP